MIYRAVLKPLLPLLNKALNRALKTDRWLMESWSVLAGRVLSLEIKELEQSVYVYLLADGVLLSLEQPDQVDVTITGDIAGLLALAKAEDPQTIILARKVKIHGDVATLQEVQRYVAMFEFDWEGEISRFVGPLAAGIAGQGLKTTKQWLEHAGHSFKKNTSEFILYEKRLFVSHEEMSDWIECIQELRLDLERLTIRLSLLEEKNR